MAKITIRQGRVIGEMEGVWNKPSGGKSIVRKILVRIEKPSRKKESRDIPAGCEMWILKGTDFDRK